MAEVIGLLDRKREHSLPPEADEALLSILYDVLAMAEEGKLHSVAIAAEYSEDGVDGVYTENYRCEGSNKYSLIGALEELKLAVLTEEEE